MRNFTNMDDEGMIYITDVTRCIKKKKKNKQTKKESITDLTNQQLVQRMRMNYSKYLKFFSL